MEYFYDLYADYSSTMFGFSTQTQHNDIIYND